MGLDRKPKSDNPVTEWIKSTSNLSSSTPEQADEINDGTALQLCDACLAALRVFSPHLSQSRQSRTGIVIFQEILIKLQLWRDGFGRGELEKVLARSRPIQNAILQHLIAISDALKYVLFASSKVVSTEAHIITQVQDLEKLINEANLIIKSDESNSDVESDDQCSSSSNESTHANKTNALREIQYHVDLLMNLLPSLYHFLEYIRQDTDHTAVVEIRFTASQAASAYINIVREKFTRAENELVERLGEANWQRHLRVRRKLEETEQEDLKEEEVLAAKSLFQPISTFHDSGLGTSVSAPSVASHSSFRTSATEGGSGSLRVPETPAEVYLGLPFKCHICGKMLTRIKNRYQWKVHVFTDLEAYICTFRGCQFSLATFPTRELWAAHEFHVHRSTKIWACSECPLKFPTSDNLAQHLQTRHSLVHVGPELQIALLAAERVENGECPFCLKTTSGKQRDFVSHVAKHMEAVALMALPKDSESDIENSLQSKSDEELEEETPDESFKMVGRSSLEIDNAARDHPLYQNVTAQADGFYHCPWEGQDGCQHKPEKLKCNYDKFVDSHLKPYRCKVLVCESLHFSSPACLLRHEREAHAMHGHGEKPFLCTYEGCERGIAGNGFPRHWNLRDHMKRVHNEPGLPKSSVSSNVGTVGSNVNPPPRPTKGKKRRGGQYDIYSAA